MKISLYRLGFALFAGLLSAPLAALEMQLNSLNGAKVVSLSEDHPEGTIPPVQHSYVNGRLVLVARPQRPLLCAGGNGIPGVKSLVIDPSGYYQPVPMAAGSGFNGDMSKLIAEGSMLRGSDQLNYDTGLYTVFGPLASLLVDGVQAYCAEGLLIDVSPTTLSCNTVPTGQSDRVFSEGFQVESDGSIQYGARVVSTTAETVTYEYIVRALGGPVYEVQLREQFPFFAGQSQPLFSRSLGLESEWNCEASEGANCGIGGNSQTGYGYVRLDNGFIPAGGCMKLTATRPVQTDGLRVGEVSGRLFGVVFYSSFQGGKMQKGANSRTRIPF